MTGFSEYRPHGEYLCFRRRIPEEVESSEDLFSDALRVREHLADVVRPNGFVFWFTYAIDDLYIDVNDPRPPGSYWEILDREMPSWEGEPAPAVTRRYSALTDVALTSTYREALSSFTCPPGLFVMFKEIMPVGISARLAGESVPPNTPVLPVTLWDNTFDLPVSSDAEGRNWLAPLPQHARYLPPVNFTIGFESILTLNLDVHWGRWLQEGTGEHALVQSALDSLVADGWEPPSGGARHFRI
ncbi:hypothetical protein ABZ319_28560 [Nocardia sp. NPDC005978]|uniref:hypothetical protein n=1 Tax=Nocardia sp. NPDC005978 TaxID=3156725 RepID=UPI0033BA6EE8